MAKIKLGSRPKNFSRIITVDLPEGGKGSVEMLFKYRTRTEFGSFVDSLLDKAGIAVKDSSEEALKYSLKKAMEATVDQNADYILQIADGWNMDEDFNRDNAAQLCDELPGAAQAIMDGYREAIITGRLGN
jgi:hypothetical protein